MAAEVHRYKVGDIEVTVLSDGFRMVPVNGNYLSNAGADHVNGLLMPDNSKAFPNAEIKVPENEWKFWMDDGEMSRAPKGRMTELFANNRRVFGALDRKVTPYAWDKEVVPGVIAVGTPGHSIGHTSYVVSSGGKTVYVQ